MNLQKLLLCTLLLSISGVKASDNLNLIGMKDANALEYGNQFTNTYKQGYENDQCIDCDKVENIDVINNNVIYQKKKIIKNFISPNNNIAKINLRHNNDTASQKDIYKLFHNNAKLKKCMQTCCTISKKNNKLLNNANVNEKNPKRYKESVKQSVIDNANNDNRNLQTLRCYFEKLQQNVGLNKNNEEIARNNFSDNNKVITTTKSISIINKNDRKTRKDEVKKQEEVNINKLLNETRSNLKLNILRPVNNIKISISSNRDNILQQNKFTDNNSNNNVVNTKNENNDANTQSNIQDSNIKQQSNLNNNMSSQQNPSNYPMYQQQNMQNQSYNNFMQQKNMYSNTSNNIPYIGFPTQSPQSIIHIFQNPMLLYPMYYPPMLSNIVSNPGQQFNMQQNNIQQQSNNTLKMKQQ